MKSLSIITIFDNYKIDSHLKIGWGFSCLIKLDNKCVLFDTGADSKILLNNIRRLKIDILDIDFIFISHLHSDHIGGLGGILKINPNLKIYRPESYSKPTKIIENIYTTGSMGTETKEQSLIIVSEKGLIIITGCAHPGIVNIMNKAIELNQSKKIYLVLGGFHLKKALDSELKKIINDFRMLKVQKVAPSHCSGLRTRELFKQEYRGDFIENGVGKIIRI